MKEVVVLDKDATEMTPDLLQLYIPLVVHPKDRPLLYYEESGPAHSLRHG